MGKGYLIDSNVIIGYLDNQIPFTGMELLNTIIDNKPNISVISKIEVLRFSAQPNVYGILQDFINETIIFSLDDLVVEKTIVICKSAKIKLPDAIIAATAIINDFILVTRDISDFKNIDGLELLNPWIAI